MNVLIIDNEKNEKKMRKLIMRAIGKKTSMIFDLEYGWEDIGIFTFYMHSKKKKIYMFTPKKITKELKILFTKNI